MKRRAAQDRRGVYADQTTGPWINLTNASGLAFAFFPEGGLHAIRLGNLVLNQGSGTPLEGGPGCIYLRLHTARGVKGWPLMGPLSGARLQVSAEALVWTTRRDGLEAECTLRLHPTEPAWGWTIRVRNRCRQAVACDVLFAQDVGLASMPALRASEAFVSHYLDHRVTRDRAWGYVLCTRQNQPQEGRCPSLYQGCAPAAAGYATDATQFHGPGWRWGEPPVALARGLPKAILQGEMALPALQTGRLTVAPDGHAHFHGWAVFRPDEAAREEREAMDLSGLRAVVKRMLRAPPSPVESGGVAVPGNMFCGRMVNGDEPRAGDLRAWFGTQWRHQGKRGTRLLSFFHGEDRHVVLPAKERISDRPTGHILRSGSDLYPGGDELSATCFMGGLFLNYVTVGNLSFNRFLSITRNSLHLQRSAGQRVFVQLDGVWRLLGLPSALEISRLACRWIYKLGQRRLVVEARTRPGRAEAELTIQVRGAPIAFRVSHEIMAGQDFMGGPVRWRLDGRGGVEFTPGPEELLAQKHPECRFTLRVEQSGKATVWGGDELLFADGIRRGYPYAVLQTGPVRRLRLTLSGRLARQRRPALQADHRDAADWAELTGGLKLTHPGIPAVARLDDMLKWQAHAALIHYMSPHGLEQFTGAAWGVRDVCQGPVEFLLALGHDEPVRRILRTVFSHQYEDTGGWPQWFMFDEYRAIQARDSHGDVGIWPLKALCDYVENTADFGLLDEPVRYMRWPQADFTREAEPLHRHVDRLLDRVEAEFIPGTALVRYGHGDWDDTLQPCNRDYAERQVSSWTVALLFQTLCRYVEVARRAGRPAAATRADRLAARMYEDYHRWLMPDGVVAGFALFPARGGEPEQWLLHPSDRKTGIRYRLISMTRGMLSGLFSAEQARHHAALIERHLTFPDGVRLVDRPVPYHGGRMQFFQRAETSAYVGREVGLMYVHAHLRYLEAMARMGRAEQAWSGLLKVTPIDLSASVPQAEPRQSNAYYSSSEGAFATRYEMMRKFSRLRAGRVPVKGGWRVYSSGPGLYVALALTGLLGVRRHYGRVVFDPVLPESLAGLTVDRMVEGQHVRLRYGSGRQLFINGNPVSAVPETGNPYRPGGFSLDQVVLRRALDRGKNTVALGVGA